MEASKRHEKLEISELNKIARVARMYYIEGKSQKDIAQNLNYSQAKVSLYIKEARERGIINFNIDSSFNEKIKEKVKNKYGFLKEVIIVPYMEFINENVEHNILDDLYYELGNACAKYFLEYIVGIVKVIKEKFGRRTDGIHTSHSEKAGSSIRKICSCCFE